ncbi:MAG: nitrate- and nitrite sensing domain-containing protein, partial [Hydrogenophaga sp.]
MQRKEFAGQERATGAALFAGGRAEASGQQQLLHLIESQERCFQVFSEFADGALLQAWHTVQSPKNLANHERMRRVLCTAAQGAPLDDTLSQAWFDTCTEGIDAMKTVEDLLSADLVTLCQQRVAATAGDLQTYERLQVDAAQTLRSPTHSTLGFFDEAQDERSHSLAFDKASPGFGQELDRSILELVQEQAQRLQSMGDELDTVRASLNERKLIERAKGLLMAHRCLSEGEAHKTLRQMAMGQNRRLVDMAEAVLAMADVLPELPR